MNEPPSWRTLVRPRLWPTWLGLALLRAITLLPLPVIAVLGRRLGIALYYLHANRRAVVVTNVCRCFPELNPAEHVALAKRHFRAFGQTVLDVGIAWWSRPARLQRLVRVVNREQYDRALAAQRPIILLAPHFVGLELGGVRLASERRFVTVFRHPDNELLKHVIVRGRARFGVTLVEHNQGFRTLLREIKTGAPLYYLPDQDAGHRSAVFAPFFGHAAATFSVLGRLAELANATVIPCVTRQLARGRGYEVIFYPALTDFPSGDPARDALRMNQAIEAAVRTMPDQYFWLHKRFKTRPEGEAPFYE